MERRSRKALIEAQADLASAARSLGPEVWSAPQGGRVCRAPTLEELAREVLGLPSP